MISFNLQFVFSFLFTIFSLGSALVCPKDISPCKCYEISTTNLQTQVRCGDSSKELPTASLIASLDKLIGDFDILYIHNTLIESLGPETVKNSTFKKIFIENNEQLSEIDVNAFNVKVQPTSLVIRNNAKFIGSHIFDLVKKHGQNLVHLELDQNSIGDIPKDALNGAKNATLQKVQFIRLDSQKGSKKMTSIGETAFANLPNLLQLSLDHNSISKIGSASAPGIDLKSTNNLTQHISIFLNNNEISADEITEKKILLPTNGSVGLVLQEANSIDLSKSQKLLLDIASNPNGRVYLSNVGKPPTCDCAGITVLLEGIKKDTNVSKNLRGIINCTKASEHVEISKC